MILRNARCNDEDSNTEFKMAGYIGTSSTVVCIKSMGLYLLNSMVFKLKSIITFTVRL